MHILKMCTYLIPHVYRFHFHLYIFSIALHFPLQLFIILANSTSSVWLPCPLEPRIIIHNRPTQSLFKSYNPLVNNTLTQHSLLECSLAHRNTLLFKNSASFHYWAITLPNEPPHQCVSTIMIICTLYCLIFTSGMYLYHLEIFFQN
jgi:hypothetical protein